MRRSNPKLRDYGPLTMSVEFVTPDGTSPTHQVPYVDVRTTEEAVAWIKRPPLPKDLLKKLTPGTLFTARYRASWLDSRGRHGEQFAAVGTLLSVGKRPTDWAVSVCDPSGFSQKQSKHGLSEGAFGLSWGGLAVTQLPP